MLKFCLYFIVCSPCIFISVEDAIEALSGMCVSPEKAKTQDAGTHVPTEESSALPVSGALPCYRASLKPKTLVLMRGLPGSGKTFLAKWVDIV